MKPKKAVAAGGRRLRLERQANGLTKRCPVEHSNPKNCPLFGLRPLGVGERRAWIRGLSLGELEYLVTYHACCAAEKIRVAAARRKRRPRAATA
ncbi:MAG: hypothetical protein HY736_12765 [Verrucomicrobia bacterium]|nr:hypothetical protein [Verrucomicrobiota bacterium]